MVTGSSRDVSTSRYQASLPVKTYPRVETLPIKEGPPINQDHVHWHSRARLFFLYLWLVKQLLAFGRKVKTFPIVLGRRLTLAPVRRPGLVGLLVRRRLGLEVSD